MISEQLKTYMLKKGLALGSKSVFLSWGIFPMRLISAKDISLFRDGDSAFREDGKVPNHSHQ